MRKAVNYNWSLSLNISGDQGGGREVPQLIEGSETYQPEVKASKLDNPPEKRKYPCLPLFVMLARRAKVPSICLPPPVQIFWICLWGLC